MNLLFLHFHDTFFNLVTKFGHSPRLEIDKTMVI